MRWWPLAVALGLLVAAFLGLTAVSPGPTTTARAPLGIKVDPVYVYLEVRKTPEEVPVIGNQTLLEYVIVVRVENPLVDPTYLRKVSVEIPEEADIRCSPPGATQQPGMSTYTIAADGRPRPPPANASKPYRVLFDYYKLGSARCAVGYSNGLLWGKARIAVDEWLASGSSTYVVVAGVAGVPKPWGYRIEWIEQGAPVKLLVDTTGKTEKGVSVRALKLVELVLKKVAPGVYVYSSLPPGVKFVLRGSGPIEAWIKAP